MSFCRLAPILAVLFAPAVASAQWAGLVDVSSELGADEYPFSGAVPGAGADERWTDAHFGDFDGDGSPDLMVGARFGLLRNALDGRMVPLRALVGWRQRGDFGATEWGDDVFRFVDVDGDGDLDAVQGGSGESLACQENVAWRWRERWVEPGRSALDIVPIDVELDGDVDLVVTTGACAQGPCGEPVELHLLINDGAGDFTEESALRGMSLGVDQTIVDVTVGDLDRDGDFDIVTHRGDSTGSSIDVGINDGSGFFVSQVFPIPTSCVGRGQSSALGDVDRDGSLDLVIARCATGQAPAEWAGPYAGGHPTIAHVVALGGGGGFFDQSSSYFDDGGFTNELAGTEVALADLDNDGDLDLLVLRLAGGGGELSHQLQIFLNQAFGRLQYSVLHSLEIPATASPGTGSLDVVDLDGDGDQDVVLGFEGDGAHIYLNRAVQPGEAPEDVPLQVGLASRDPVVLQWYPPVAASPVRYFRVYRSLADRMHVQDRELIGVVGASAHLDTGFYGMVDERTLNSQLGNSNASIEPGTRRVQFADPDAREGVGYFYSVTTVGPGHVESAPSPEVFAELTPGIVADTQPPEIAILSPTEQDWQRSPRVAVAFGDDLSEVDRDSIHVSFDVPLGDLAAGEDLSVERAHRRDADAFIAYLEPPYELPADTTVTMTARVSDQAGNEGAAQVTFTTTAPDAPQPTPTAPEAVFALPIVSRAAPVSLSFDGRGSSDPDGELLRHEWYVRANGDGADDVADDPIAFGARAEHFFAYGGEYTVTLLVRDADGNVDSMSRVVTLMGSERVDAGPPMVDGGPPFDAGPPMPRCGSQTCGVDPMGFSCGTCGPRQVCQEPEFVCVCAAGESMCGSICGVDFQNDREHCGGCFRRCAIGTECNGGSCQTAPELGGCGCRAVADPTAPSPPAPLLWLLLLLGLRYLPTAARRSSTIVSAMR